MDVKREKLATWLAIVWGVVVACWVTRHFFQLPPATFFRNDDASGYLLRQIEFQDCLANGYWSPQWCTDFRAGLGSPYFSFYQCGWFYFVSLFAWCDDVVRQVGLAVTAISIVGYVGIFALIVPRFGPLAGALSGTFLLTSEYMTTDVYLRGDFSEYAATMLVPGWLWSLQHVWADETERPHRMWPWHLPWLTAGIALTHPCIALEVAIVGGLLIAVWFARSRNGQQLKITIAALLAGGGLAASYWAPLVGEWSLVQADAAFVGFFHYSKNFVWFLELFNSEKTNTVSNVKFGAVPTAILTFGVITTSLQCRLLASHQRRILVTGMLLGAVSLFLVTHWSHWLWDFLPLLNRLQFPWRFLALATVGCAIVVGVLGNSRSGKLAQGIAVVLILLLVANRYSTPRIKPTKFQAPSTPREIANEYFAPDVANEWLPRHANEFAEGEPLQKTYTGPDNLIAAKGDHVIVRSAHQTTGKIVCDVSASQPATIVLRHFFYPVGWRATLNATPTALRRNSQGLMEVEVPAGFDGRLQIEFQTTPARRCGLALALAVATSLIAVELWRLRKDGSWGISENVSP